jgi:hypothetical protein
MSEESSLPSSPGTRYNAPSTRVTIAFPFSTIKLREPDERIVELAEVVAALAERLALVAPGAETAQLVERARASVAAFKG